MPDTTDRLEREVAAAFKDVVDARPDDDAKLAAMIAVALKPPPGGSPPASGGAATKLWPALVGVGGLVVAAAVLLSRGEAPPQNRAELAPDPPVAAAPVVAAPQPMATSEVPAAPASAPLDVHAVQPRPSPARPTRPRAVASTPAPDDEREVPDDPDALVRAANQARRARSFDAADRLYTDLQARFPDSRAARTSRVPHGRLLLDTLARPADALAAFSAYLAADARGTLGEEALVGRAEALGALGRGADARDAWRSLLERFPESVHAPTAQRQIAEAGP